MRGHKSCDSCRWSLGSRGRRSTLVGLLVELLKKGFYALAGVVDVALHRDELLREEKFSTSYCECHYLYSSRVKGLKKKKKDASFTCIDFNKKKL